MDKKAYVLELLKKLEPYRDVVTGIIAMIEIWTCTDEDIDSIINLIEDHTKEVKDQDLKDKLTRAQGLLAMIKKQEETKKINEEKEIEELLEQIKSF